MRTREDQPHCRLASQIPGAAIVHTDDVAWYECAFNWVGLLTSGVLEPVRRGEPSPFARPRGTHGAEGAIEVPAGIALLLVEGVGSGRRSLTALLDAVVYVQSDVEVSRDRDKARVAAGEIDPEDYVSWMTEEDPSSSRSVPGSARSPSSRLTGAPHDADDEVVLGVPV